MVSAPGLSVSGPDSGTAFWLMRASASRLTVRLTDAVCDCRVCRGWMEVRGKDRFAVWQGFGALRRIP